MKFLDINGLQRYNSKLLSSISFIKSTKNGVTADNTSGGMKSLVPSGVGFRYYSDINQNMTGMFPSAHNANGLLSFKRHGEPHYSQMALSSDGNIYHRSGAMTTEVPWRTVVDTGNLNNTLGGLLTAFARTGANNNTVSINVAGTTKSIELYPHSRYGTRYFNKPDNSGRATLVLIADITSLVGKTETEGGDSWGFTGRITMTRWGGGTNGCEHNIDITARAAWADLPERVDLRSSWPDKIQPKVVDYDGKRYIALLISGSASYLMFTGWWVKCLDSFIELPVPSGATLPEGVKVVYNYTNGMRYIASQAVKLSTPRTLWGQSFDGSANVSGDLTGVGGISASKEIITSSSNAFRAYNSQRGVIQRLDTTHFWILMTDDGDPKGQFNSLRPFSIRMSDGRVSLGNGVMNVDHMGNVGIGTGSPTDKLHVNGTMRVTGHMSGVSFASGIKSGSMRLVAREAKRTLVESTIGMGNNYVAVTKTWGETGAFVQQQNGRYGYEFKFIPKEMIQATDDSVDDTSLTLLRLNEDNTIYIGDRTAGSTTTVNGTLILRNPVNGKTATLTVDGNGDIIVNGSGRVSTTSIHSGGNGDN